MVSNENKFTLCQFTIGKGVFNCYMETTANLLLLKKQSLFLTQVESNLLPVLTHWKRQYTLETVLIELRK